ncbi:MAG: DNA polymerase III subunit beta [Gammaproteobacteria bacterium]|nr:DNA polymerase III subunit beta [Gammaproteobacteria bacterium]MYD80564.1 DNA polymerase III subunit beta [Gammaproteobacteria bacterium]
MHAAIADNEGELEQLCVRYDVLRLFVFGSAARSVDFDPQFSDADFLVEFKAISRLSPFEQFFDFAGALRQILGRSVNLVEVGAVRNHYLCSAMNKDRELIYESCEATTIG